MAVRNLDTSLQDIIWSRKRKSKLNFSQFCCSFFQDFVFYGFINLYSSGKLNPCLIWTRLTLTNKKLFTATFYTQTDAFLHNCHFDRLASYDYDEWMAGNACTDSAHALSCTPLSQNGLVQLKKSSVCKAMRQVQNINLEESYVRATKPSMDKFPDTPPLHSISNTKFNSLSEIYPFL